VVVKEQYQIKISNGLVALENLVDNCLGMCKSISILQPKRIEAE
jgi:hypothetical protein